MFCQLFYCILPPMHCILPAKYRLYPSSYTLYPYSSTLNHLSPLTVFSRLFNLYPRNYIVYTTLYLLSFTRSYSLYPSSFIFSTFSNNALYRSSHMCSILYTQTDNSLHFALFHAAVLHIPLCTVYYPKSVGIFSTGINSFVTVLMFCEKGSAKCDDFPLQFVRTQGRYIMYLQTPCIVHS
jgi:hypothetical protein